MKLYIKQKVFSIGSKYDIYDVNESVVFNVKGEVLALAAKLHLYDPHGRELYFIKKKITFLLAKYEIYRNNTLCATISQEFTMFKKKLNVDSTLGSFTIQGDFLSMDYQIYKNNNYFGSIHKKWLSWGDSYELDIPNVEDAAFVCALVIAIDNCLHNDN